MAELRAQDRRMESWRRLTPEQRDYDRFVARQTPFGLLMGEKLMAETAAGRVWKENMLNPGDGEGSCYCHLTAPCGYCESRVECEECGEFVREDELDEHMDSEHPDAAARADR